MHTILSLKFLKGLAILGGAIGIMVGFMIYTVKRSKDPAAIQVKWIATIIIISLLLAFVRGIDLFSYGGAFTVPVLCAAVGVILAILWGKHIAAFLISPLTNAISGGDDQVKAQPLYSMAQARRKLGKPTEALQLVQVQLKKFPHDFEGEMLLASIYVEDLNDLSRGELMVQRICSREGTPANRIAGALNTLADWQQRYGQDSEKAREALAEVSRLLPDTDYDRAARQRTAHLATDQELRDQRNRPKVVMKEGIKRIGLIKDAPDLNPETPSPSAEAASLVKHMQQFPDDNEAGERLAHLYAEDFHRPEMGIDELERLIIKPHQLPKDIARWLNAIADIQIRQQGTVAGATATLQRIIDLFPKAALADIARSRISMLGIEKRGQKKGTAVTLGEYEQRLGLKGSGNPQRREEDGDPGRG